MQTKSQRCILCELLRLKLVNLLLLFVFRHKLNLRNLRNHTLLILYMDMLERFWIDDS